MSKIIVFVVEWRRLNNDGSWGKWWEVERFLAAGEANESARKTVAGGEAEWLGTEHLRWNREARIVRYLTENEQ